MLAHEASEAAAAQGKFWEMHDLLFAHQGKLGEEDLLRYAKELGLDVESFRHALDARIYKPLVDENLAEARGLGIGGTPTFFINGKRIIGAQKLEALEAAVDEALGVAPDPGPTDGAGKTNPALNIGDARVPGPVERVEIGGSPARGPTQAQVTIVEFADFQCPFCARAVPTIQELARQYPNDIRWVFKNYPLEFHPDSLLAHRAALAAGEQGKFWEMHDLIFANQGAMKRGDLIQEASQLGLDVKRFVADLDGNGSGTRLAADKAEAARLEVTGTPTFFINGRRMVGTWPLAAYKKLVEAELNGPDAKAIATAPSAPPAAPINTKETNRPGSLSKIDFATKGPDGAPVTIIWYSDLESPLSPQAAVLIRELTGAYSGKVRVVFKNLPMDFHPHAVLAHEAALAAGVEGKFWEMHDLILSNQQALTRNDLIGYAKRLGLNVVKFTSRLDGDEFRKMLNDDLAEAKRRGVFGSPAFFVNGKRLDGLQPLAVFREVIQAELDGVTAAKTGQ